MPDKPFNIRAKTAFAPEELFLKGKLEKKPDRLIRGSGMRVCRAGERSAGTVLKAV
jgi:hypothetical protein